MAVRFLDGPAAGKALELQRTPYFLRVTIDPEGGVDALDQLDDVARSDEVIYVYRIKGVEWSGFVCSRGKGCQRVIEAAYECTVPRNCGSIPTDAVLRDNETWAKWAKQEYDRQQTLLEAAGKAPSTAAGSGDVRGG